VRQAASAAAATETAVAAVSGSGFCEHEPGMLTFPARKDILILGARVAHTLQLQLTELAFADNCL
jgi:hypothetical protein